MAELKWRYRTATGTILSYLLSNGRSFWANFRSLSNLAIYTLHPQGVFYWFKNNTHNTYCSAPKVFVRSCLLATKTTKNKVRSVLNMVFNHALDEGIIEKNPLASHNLRIKGKSSAVTLPYSVKAMQYIVGHIEMLSNSQDQTYIALAALHPLRPEEVFGLQWQDIDIGTHTIFVRRAVTHPSRNLGVVGEPKTEASKRILSLVPRVEKYLHYGPPNEFVLGGQKPLSYTQVRRMCRRIEKQINFPERIQPRRFRTTVLTDIYDMTKDIKSAQAAAGHTTAAMTLRYYVKGRAKSQDTATPIAKAYGVETDN